MESDGPAPEARETTCPAPEKLRDFLDERISLSQTEIAHIAECRNCARLLDRLSARGALVSSQSVASALASAPAVEPELTQLMEQIQVFLQRAARRDTAKRPAAASTAAGPTRDDDPETSTHRATTYASAKFTSQQLESALPSDRFHVQRLLSHGGSAAVYLAYDQRLQRNVAIKVVARERVADRRRFEREARLLASFDHPHIVAIYDFGELQENGDDPSATAYLVMEYLAGGSLVEALLAQRLPGFAALAELLAEAARGVHAAHCQGLVHRDVKPANILLSEDLETAKIGDFGLARRTDVDRSLLTRDGDIVGTPAYMSPEQIERGDDVGIASDVYGLGATLYTALTGEPPFRGSIGALLRQVQEADPVAPRLIDPRIPIKLETICLKAMEKRPGDRYASAEAFAHDLLNFAKGRPISARPISATGKLVRLLRRNPTLGIVSLTTALLAAMLVLGSVTAAVLFARQREQLRIEATRAETARNTAERSLVAAIDAADELLVAVTQDAELLPRTPGSQAVSARLLERAQSFYQSLIDQHGNTPRLALARVRAHVGLAKILHRRGDHHGVEREAQQALRILEARPPLHLPPDEYALWRADALTVLGNSQVDAGNAKQAAVTLASAVAACRAARKDDTTQTSDDLLATHAASLRALADAATTFGRHAEARMHLTEAQALFQRLLSGDSAAPATYRDAAMVDMSLATMAIDRGDVLEGKQHLLRAAELLQRTGEAYEYSLRVRELLGTVQINLGLAERRLGNNLEAEAAYRQAIKEFQRLSELEPDVANHKWLLVTATLNLGGPLLAQGRPEETVEAWQAIVPVLDDLIAMQPESLRYVQVKAMLQSNIAIVLRDLGRAEQAIDPLVSATKILEEQSKRVDNAPEAYLPVALNYYELASTYLSLERFREAEESVQAADEICHDLLSHQPDFLPAKGQLLDNLFLRLELGKHIPDTDLAARRELATQAVQLAEQLLAAQPELVEYQVELPRALIARGRISLNSDAVGMALADVLKAEALLEEAFSPPWEGVPRATMRDALLLHAQCLAAQIDEAIDQTERQAAQVELERILAQAMDVGVSAEDVNQLRP
ncbi:MAG: hypothetical protein KatS3mg111_1820 [Pirellulaceae bacterium]|nr:MAG: hypothetical protein KatS3mg111_1820 [Pirellulaceae bacterium]